MGEPGNRYDWVVFSVMVAYSLPAWALGDVSQHPGYAAFFIDSYTTFGYTPKWAAHHLSRPSEWCRSNSLRKVRISEGTLTRTRSRKKPASGQDLTRWNVIVVDLHSRRDWSTNPNVNRPSGFLKMSRPRPSMIRQPVSASIQRS